MATLNVKEHPCTPFSLRIVGYTEGVLGHFIAEVDPEEFPAMMECPNVINAPVNPDAMPEGQIRSVAGILIRMKGEKV